MNNAEYLARYLQRRGVTHVFEVIGGMTTFLIDALHRHSGIKVVAMHHEQGAAFAAEGWARMTGIPGVAMATSGPGATNLITPIGSCFFDSVPAVFITGQVNRHEQKGDRAIRQLGFQETDIVSMIRPITKAAWLVDDADTLPDILDEAFRIALSGRPGPVLIDIPMDVQRHVIAGSVSESFVPSPPPTPHPSSERDEFLDRLARELASAARPIVLVGGGIRSARAVEPFRRLVAHLEIPVFSSLLGVDALPATDPMRIGMIGSYGNRWANLGLSESDLIVVLGSRMDIRQTGSDVEGFRADRAFFHVDCEPGELNNRVSGCDALTEDLSTFLATAPRRLPAGAGFRPRWLARLRQLRADWPDTKEVRVATGINPNAFMHALSRSTQFCAAYVADVGQHQMWAAQSLDLLAHQRFLTSGGMGAMGFGLPAAVGASFASGPVVMIAGDGGFQLNIQELQTVVRNRLPLKLIVLNNACYGMVRQFQESYFNQRYHSTLWGYDTPDFAKVATAYGITAERIQDPADVDTALARLGADPEAPYLLEVIIDTSINAYPKLAFGRRFGEMEPMVSPVEMEGT